MTRTSLSYTYFVIIVTEDFFHHYCCMAILFLGTQHSISFRLVRMFRCKCLNIIKVNEVSQFDVWLMFLKLFFITYLCIEYSTQRAAIHKRRHSIAIFSASPVTNCHQCLYSLNDVTNFSKIGNFKRESVAGISHLGIFLES